MRPMLRTKSVRFTFMPTFLPNRDSSVWTVRIRETAWRTSRWFWQGLSLSLGVWPILAQPQLQVVRDNETQRIFAGDARNISVSLRNTNDQVVTVEGRIRLYQLSSATAVLLKESAWKNVQVLPGQTVMESAALDCPAVKAETRFLVQWIGETNKVIGKTEVLVYPRDILKGLKPLVSDDDGAVGVFDPQNQLKPLLKSAALSVVDLEDAGLEDFRGKLAIVGPFESKAKMRQSLAKQIETQATKGAGVVWIQPPAARRDKLQPSFYVVPAGRVAVVVVQAEMVSNLPESPQSQLNLIHFARLALHPEPVRLPDLTPQP